MPILDDYTLIIDWDRSPEDLAAAYGQIIKDLKQVSMRARCIPVLPPVFFRSKTRANPPVDPDDLSFELDALNFK